MAESPGFPCQTCAKTLVSQKSLKGHIRDVHIRAFEEDRIHECEECSKAFPTKNALVVHNRIHTGERPYTCKVCGKSFAHGSAFNSHTKIHSPNRATFACKECEKSFTRGTNLKQHMDRTHSKILYSKLEHDHKRLPMEKKYLCMECGKCCVSNFNLKKHMYTQHTLVKKPPSMRKYKKDMKDEVGNFAIMNSVEEACKKFEVPDGTVRRWVKILTNPVKCELCGKDFPIEKELRKHIQVNHDTVPYQRGKNLNVDDKKTDNFLGKNKSFFDQYKQLSGHADTKISEELTSFTNSDEDTRLPQILPGNLDMNLSTNVYKSQQNLNSHKSRDKAAKTETNEIKELETVAETFEKRSGELTSNTNSNEDTSLSQISPDNKEAQLKTVKHMLATLETVVEALEDDQSVSDSGISPCALDADVNDTPYQKTNDEISSDTMVNLKHSTKQFESVPDHEVTPIRNISPEKDFYFNIVNLAASRKIPDIKEEKVDNAENTGFGVDARIASDDQGHLDMKKEDNIKDEHFSEPTDSQHIIPHEVTSLVKIEKSEIKEASNEKDQKQTETKRKSNISKIFECNFCQKIFKHQCDLTRHQIRHTKVKQFKCDQCDKYFAYKNDVKRHAIKNHLINGPYTPPLKILCSECGKEFTNKNNLVIHQRTHSGEKPFKCDICSENFRIDYQLEKHKVKDHNEPYPKICESCGKGFFTFRFSEAWENHQKNCGTIKQPKETVCKICNKNFKKSDGYNRHMKSHLKLKDYSCSDCEKCFADKRNLLIHREKSHKILTVI